MASGAAAATKQQLDKISAALIDAPGETEVTRALAAIAQADERLRRARKDAAERRADLAAADKGRTSLTPEEQKARARLHKSRDSVVRSAPRQSKPPARPKPGRR